MHAPLLAFYPYFCLLENCAAGSRHGVHGNRTNITVIDRIGICKLWTTCEVKRLRPLYRLSRLRCLGPTVSAKVKVRGVYVHHQPYFLVLDSRRLVIKPNISLTGGSPGGGVDYAGANKSDPRVISKSR
jgi:hypothetical protein